MSYESIKKALTEFYFGELPEKVKRIKERVFAEMNEYDAANQGASSYKLKSELYRRIAEAVEPTFIEDVPFFFETGSLMAVSDGRYNRGAVSANAWLYLRNEHIFRDFDPKAYDIYVQNKADGLYSQVGSFVDMMHQGIPMKKLFAVGFSGIMEELSAALSENITEAEREFLECAVCGIKALDRIRERFAEAAKASGNTELYEIASRVPWEAPETYHEGLCTLAFIRKALGAIEGMGFNSFGRVDVLLAPLYDNDIKNGVSEDNLLELTEKFLIVWDCTYDRNKENPQIYEYELENTLTLGGTDAEGNHIYNGVTRLFIKARANTDAVYPKFMLRYSKNSPEEYLTLISASMLENKNFSLYENDDSMIPALMEAGVAKEDAADFVVGGCWDAITPECSNKFSGEYLSLLYPLEWSIHNITDKMERNELYFPPLDDAETFDELYSRYMGYVNAVLRRKALPMVAASKLWDKVNPVCATSAMMQTCIKKRLDITAGGGKYNREAVYFTCFADVANSLLVIKKLCFDAKKYTVKQLFDACRDNWPDEAMRLEAISVCSFGDGSEESSRFVEKMYNDLYDMVKVLPTSYGGTWRMGFNLYTEVTFWAERIAATPNGRKYGDYISQGFSPSRYMKSAAVTDYIGSYRYINMNNCAGNSSVSIMMPAGKFDAATLNGFFRAVAASGIQALQPNIVDKNELLAAEKEPEKYGHIIVRVCGFSAPFVNLHPRLRREILDRSFAE